MENVAENKVAKVAENVVIDVTDVAENVVADVAENVVADVAKVAENVVAEVADVVTNVAETAALLTNKKDKEVAKEVKFLVDVESKAIVESCMDIQNFNVSNLMSVLPKLIQHVENYKNLTGKQKRSLVIKMLRHIIDVTDGPGNDDIWDPIIKQLVPSLIDTLIEVNDGKLKLKKKPKCLKKLLCCF